MNRQSLKSAAEPLFPIPAWSIITFQINVAACDARQCVVPDLPLHRPSCLFPLYVANETSDFRLGLLIVEIALERTRGFHVS